MKTILVILIGLCLPLFTLSQKFDVGPTSIEVLEESSRVGLEVAGTGGYYSSFSLMNNTSNFDWKMTSWTDRIWHLVNMPGTTFSSILVEPNHGSMGLETSEAKDRLHLYDDGNDSDLKIGNLLPFIISRRNLRLGNEGLTFRDENGGFAVIPVKAIQGTMVKLEVLQQEIEELKEAIDKLEKVIIKVI